MRGITICRPAWILAVGLWAVAPRIEAEVKSMLPFSGDTVTEDAIRSFAPTEPAGIGDRERLRISFYNIEMFTDGIKDGDDRKETVAAQQAAGAAAIIDEIGADIQVISEIENERILGILNGKLKNPFPYGYVSDLGSGSGRIEKMNIAVLSRIAPESVKEVDFGLLAGPGRPTRGLVRATFDLGDNHALVIYGAHFKSNFGDRQKNYSQRVNTMSILLNDVSALFDENPERKWEIMLVGDFNTDPMLSEFDTDPTLKVLPNWVDLWSEHPDKASLFTVITRRGDPTREFPPALFDRILVHPDLKAKPWATDLPHVVEKGTSENIKDTPGQGGHVSDHYPVYLEIVK